MKLLSAKTQILGALVASLLMPSFALADHQAFVLASVPVELADMDRVENSGTSVTFATGQVGTASLRVTLINHTDTFCGNQLTWNTLRLITNDNSPITSVTATLFRAPLAGTSAGTGLQVATVTSTDSAGFHSNVVGFTHTFDFCDNAYYVRVNLTRTTTAANVSAFAIQLS